MIKVKGAYMIIDVFVTAIIPVMLAGTLNMIWCRLPCAKALARPLDAGKLLRDGKRLFGENKTWKGLVGMTVLGALAMAVCGGMCVLLPRLGAHNLIHAAHGSGLLLDLGVGALVGVCYSLCELPNSFIKRRFDVEPGKPYTRGRGLKSLFFLLDNSDSAFGCMLAICAVCGLGVREYLLGLLLGTAVHAPFNALLYAVKLRKNIF